MDVKEDYDVSIFELNVIPVQEKFQSLKLDGILLAIFILLIGVLFWKGLKPAKR